MLRKTLIALGLLVALLPSLGFPYAFTTSVSTFAGLAIALLVLFSRRRKVQDERVVDAPSSDTQAPRIIQVERRDVPDMHGVHIVREIVSETKWNAASPEEKIMVEKKTTVRRGRRKQAGEMPQLEENT